MNPTTRLDINPLELQIGDVVAVDGATGRVMGEPRSSHRDWSAFDELKVLVGVTARTTDTGD